MTKVPDKSIEAAYEVAKLVYEEKLSFAEGRAKLNREYLINANTAGDLIDNLARMLDGRSYVRTNNLFATEYFLTKIHEDFGVPALAKAVGAVDRHVEYYRKLEKGSDQPGVRKIADRFRRIVQDATETRDFEGLTRSQREIFDKKLAETAFDASDLGDARERVIGSIVRRQGQEKFRKRLLSAYGGKCAISGCDVLLVLDAAHIVPYRGPKTDHHQNGLLLRTDLHTLFDVGLIAVDSATMSVVTASRLRGTEYEVFNGKRLRLPANQSDWPSKQALDIHRSQSDCNVGVSEPSP